MISIQPAPWLESCSDLRLIDVGHYKDCYVKRNLREVKVEFRTDCRIPIVLCFTSFGNKNRGLQNVHSGRMRHNWNYKPLPTKIE